VGEVNRFGDRIVDVPLEGRLNPEMPLGSDVMGGDEMIGQGGVGIPFLPLFVNRVDVPELTVQDLRGELKGKNGFDR